MEKLLQELLQKMDILIAQTAPKKKPRQIRIDTGETLERLIEPYRAKYGPSTITDFLLYWNQPNKKGIPLWKTKEAFEIGMRLSQWERREEKMDYEKSQRFALKQVEEKPVHREPVTEREDRGFQKLFI